MFFGGLKGVNSFIPDEINLNTLPPAVLITSLSLNNQPLRTDLAPDETIRLSYKDNNLSLDFVALDYTAPAKNQYAYKMEGLDSDWIESGDRRHADYPNLRPGDYTFRVKASNNSGIWNEQGAALHITITPPFWQTWWFLGTLGLVVVGAILAGFRLRLKGLETHKRDLEKQVQERTRALEQKAQELEALLAENTRLSQQSQELAVLEERNRLARDLHDSITQSLFGITLNAEIAARLLHSGEINQTGLSLQELKALALDALGEMRLMIYELRPSVFDQEGLVAALQARLDAVEGRVGLQTNLVLQGEIRLAPQFEAGLYRIAQEALNNVLKHAHASHVTIHLAQDAQLIAMEIADDGVGFDPLLAADAGGMGLRNMQERARELGFNFEVLSRPGQGTKIMLRRPLP
jgi:signal transduction histidine kinase